MSNFDLKKYLAENKLLKENEPKVSQWLIDSFIDGVKGQKEYGEAWNLYATKGEEYDQLLTAAEETLASTDSGETTPEELIDAAQLYALGKGIKSVDENKLLKENKYQIWGKISLLINQHISDKQVVKQLLDLIDDYGIESYGEGEDDANKPEFY